MPFFFFFFWGGDFLTFLQVDYILVNPGTSHPQIFILDDFSWV